MEKLKQNQLSDNELNTIAGGSTILQVGPVEKVNGHYKNTIRSLTLDDAAYNFLKSQDAYKDSNIKKGLNDVSSGINLLDTAILLINNGYDVMRHEKVYAGNGCIIGRDPAHSYTTQELTDGYC